MKCAIVWRKGYAELRVMQCNAYELEYLERQIGKSVEVELRPTPYALDGGTGCATEGESTPENLSAGEVDTHHRQ